MLKKYFLIVIGLFIIVGCGNTKSHKVYEQVDVVQYLEAYNMIKNFNNSGGSDFSLYSSFNINIEDTVTRDENKIIHHYISHGTTGGGHIQEDSNNTEEVYYDKENIYNLEENEVQNRYIDLTHEIQNKSTLNEKLFQFIENDSLEIGTTTIKKIDTCIYSKIANVELGSVIYEGDYLKYECHLKVSKKYNIDDISLQKYPELSKKNGMYSISEKSFSRVYEAEVGLVKENHMYKENREYCKNEKCSLDNSYQFYGVKYLLK